MKTSCGRTYKGLGGNGEGIGNGKGPSTGTGRGLCGPSGLSGPFPPCGGTGAQGGSSVWPVGRGIGAGAPAGGLGGCVVGGGMWFGGNTQPSPFGLEPGGGLKARI